MRDWPVNTVVSSQISMLVLSNYKKFTIITTLNYLRLPLFLDNTGDCERPTHIQTGHR